MRPGSKRKIAALAGIPIVLRGALKALLALDLKRVTALIAIIPQLFGSLFFDGPVTPYGEKIDMSRFELTWQDEFDHGFDEKLWEGHYVYSANDTQKRDVAYWNRGQVSFTDDGCLKITVERKDGPAGLQYYSYGMDTNPNKHYSDGYEGYEQLYGYFEVRCILPRGAGINPAFWLLTDGMWADDTDGGVSGAEVDVLETRTDCVEGSRFYGSVNHTIHVDSYEQAHRSEFQGNFYADDPYEKFNTYGVEWNPDGYIFYVNGVESARTDFGGVCEVPLYLILSVGVDERINGNEFLPTSFVVDYVRAYKYK